MTALVGPYIILHRLLFSSTCCTCNSLTVKAVQSLPAHVIVEGLPKAVTSTFLKTTPGTLQELSTTTINLNSVDHKLVQALMPFQQEGVR